ncbi:MAG: FdhF/YdeP family oxidoreductase [Proteobacteria bacterium]|nr:FdhF/YdeP family oxidoreductase [Pseudomonadota bacterium]MDA1298850.1 FdhF/YdeP family oxidoreductase [Pseudomonadota bacterium]
MTAVSKPAVGGGMKKVLYTLQKVRAMGVAKATRTLVSHNTCKACALGMGGQAGGMTNELGEFPAVCNKSVQAQSTDAQPAIPDAIFDHSISELSELNERELAGLGRLNTPLYKRADSDRFEPVAWRTALFMAAERFKKTQPSRSFFYSSGRASNEAGFVLQLFARIFGTNNVNNCSYYCHQATSVALGETIGTGTATVELEDLTRCDLVFIIGANPASNHPRLLHQLKACRDRGGQVVVINPAREPGLVRFAVPKSPRSMIAGGTEIASAYLQPNIGTDQTLLMALAKAVMEDNAVDGEFIELHTDGFEPYAARVRALDWQDIERLTGVSADSIQDVAKRYCAANNTVFAWGMGLTHHLDGVGNVEQVVNLALLRGMIGKPAAGLLPLRGHSNVQGIGTIGVKPVLAREIIQEIETLFDIRMPEDTGLDTMAAMQAADAGEIDLALLMGGNLYASNPNSNWAERALGRISTKIFLTTTLNRGHLMGTDGSEALILPVTARDEEWQPTTQESMFNFVRLSDGGIKRLDGVRPESWIIAEIANLALGKSPLDFTAFQQHSKVREAIARIIPGMEALADIDVAKKEFHIRRRILHEPTFNTASGRARFVIGGDQPSPATTTRPFRLSTVRSEGQFNSIVYEDEDVYRQTTSRWCVMMCPDDISAMGLKPGDPVDIESDDGTMLNVTAVAFDLPPGNCMCYYPEANMLTSTRVDPRSQTPAFKCTDISILPHRPGRVA